MEEQLLASRTLYSFLLLGGHLTILLNCFMQWPKLAPSEWQAYTNCMCSSVPWLHYLFVFIKDAITKTYAKVNSQYLFIDTPSNHMIVRAPEKSRYNLDFLSYLQATRV